MVVPSKKETCFWPAKTRKNLTFSRCIHLWDLVLKSCLEIHEGNWIQLPFVSAVLVKKVASFVDFFVSVSGFRLKFSRIALLRKRLQLDSKNDLTRNGLILEFFVGIWLYLLTSWTEICMNCSSVLFFWRHQIL